MDMDEESYLLLQILLKLFKTFKKTFPSKYEQQLDELSKRNLPNRYTLEIKKLTKILMKEDYSNDFVIEQSSDLYELDLEKLRNSFEWSEFLQTFIHYMCKGIIQVSDNNVDYFTKLYDDLFQVLERHREKGTRTYSWKELEKITTIIVENNERILREQVEAEMRETTAKIGEFVLRIIDRIYKLTLVYVPPQLQTKLNEFPNNSHERLLDATAKALPLLLNDPALRTKIDEVDSPNDVRSVLEACVYRSKMAALRYRENQASDYSLDVYESTMKEFLQLQSQLPLNLLWEHVKCAANDIVDTYNESGTNEKSADVATCENDDDEDLLKSNASNSDTQKLVDDPLPDGERRKKKCCSMF